MDGKKIKIIGIAASLIGAGATLISNWVSDKQIDSKVTEKVSETISKTLEQK